MAHIVNPPLLVLPAEVLQCILSYLSPKSLATVSGACRVLRAHAESDLLWQNFVQDNVPGILLESPFPCRSFKELYVAHHPHWFVARHQVWYSDGAASGKIIIARYDPRRGCIEAYRLVAERRNPVTIFGRWEHYPEVMTVCSDFHLQLHLDEPILKLDPTPVHPEHSKSFSPETPLPTIDGTIYSTISLARHIPPALWTPSMELWPPNIIPAWQRVQRGSRDNFRSLLPQNLAQASDQAFRIRQWVKFASDVRIGESVTTYGTIGPELWTPTRRKPWRGIWVGDYLGHGCEFLLLHQPNTVSPESAVSEDEDGDEGEYGSDGQTDIIYEGRLEAIKLTGDPHVPRGEYSWIAEDIGKGGFLRVAEDEMFRGARIVKSKGYLFSRERSVHACRQMCKEHDMTCREEVAVGITSRLPDEAALELQRLKRSKSGASMTSSLRLSDRGDGDGGRQYCTGENPTRQNVPYRPEYTATDTSTASIPCVCICSGILHSHSAPDRSVMAASKYYLQVTAGPSYDRATHGLVNVNSPTPLFISQPHADIHLSIKIQGYRGLPNGSPSTSPYFSHPKHLNDQYSISFALLPKTPVRGDHLVFGNDFDNPIRDRLPPGFNTAFKIVKWAIDPGLDGDVYSDTPYLYGPALSSLNILQVGERADQLPEWRDEMEVFEEGGERGDVPAESARRMKYFLEERARKEWVFQEGRVYECDFFNGFLDFNQFALRLPGFTLPILKYLDVRQKTLRPHKLRYVLKNRESGLVYFVVVFTLLRRDGRDGGDEGAFGNESDDEVVMEIEEEKAGDMSIGDGHEYVPREDDLD